MHFLPSRTLSYTSNRLKQPVSRCSEETKKDSNEDVKPSGSSQAPLCSFIAVEKKERGIYPRGTAETAKTIGFQASWNQAFGHRENLRNLHNNGPSCNSTNCKANAVKPFWRHSVQNHCTTAGVYVFTGNKWIKTSLGPSIQKGTQSQVNQKGSPD